MFFQTKAKPEADHADRSEAETGSPRLDRDALSQAADKIANGAHEEILKGTDPASRFLRPVAQAMHNRIASSLKSIVNIWVEQTTPLLVIAEMSDNLRNMEQRSQAVATASEEMSASISEVAHTADLVSQDSQSVKQELTHSIVAVGQAVTTMDGIASAFGALTDKVQALDKASEQIAQILKTIEQIASQTNLLALNATIEAARAGEAGKGFAVVASEVKTLAKQTSSATEDIRQRISTLQSGMSDMLSSMADGTSRVEQGSTAIKSVGDGMQAVGVRVDAVVEKMVSVSAAVRQQSAVTSEVAGNIAAIVQMARQAQGSVDLVTQGIEKSSVFVQGGLADIFQNPQDTSVTSMLVQVAKSDHATFKKKVIDTLVGHGSWKSTEVPDHHACRLGKWFDTVTDDTIRALPAYRHLEDPHLRVHAHGKRALELFAKGDTMDALTEAKKLDGASQEVLAILDDLYKEIERA
ncbi:MAG: methyl-accepting chemotaxis protein [Alphaproteobacteria bacterium]|nr:methyl-accepting chemotaxis protein [Alphaproteobacteria bacterium]